MVRYIYGLATRNKNFLVAKYNGHWSIPHIQDSNLLENRLGYKTDVDYLTRLFNQLSLPEINSPLPLGLFSFIISKQKIRAKAYRVKINDSMFQSDRKKWVALGDIDMHPIDPISRELIYYLAPQLAK